MNAAEAFNAELTDFVDGLRKRDYSIGTRQFIAVQDLVTSLAARGTLLEDVYNRRLTSYVGPIVCNNPEQQDEFHTEFDRWLNRVEGLFRATSESEVAARRRRSSERLQAEFTAIDRGNIRWKRWLGRGTGVVVMATIAFLVGRIVEGLSPELALPDIPFWWLAVPVVLLGGGWLGWKAWTAARTNRFLERRVTSDPVEITRILTEGADRAVFDGQALYRTAQRLRQHRPLGHEHLDIPRTVQRTVEAGGLFTPVTARRFVMPEYLVLVDRATFRDHETHRVDGLVDQLIEHGVIVDRFHFDRDPRVCYPEHEADRPLTLVELAAKYPEHRLLVFSDGEGMVSRSSGRLANWTETFGSWGEKTVLTLGNPKGLLGRQLVDADFFVFPATERGLDALAQTPAAPDRRWGLTDDLPPDFPWLLRGRPVRWLHSKPPDDATVARMLHALQDYLDPSGYYWLCACAVYPEIRWHMTLKLGQTLKRNGNWLLDKKNLTALGRLPWFRQGRMPDWVRLALLESLDDEEEKDIRAAVHALLVTASQAPESGEVQEIAGQEPELGEVLEIASEYSKTLPDFADRFVRLLRRRSPPDGPLREYVFSRFMAGRLGVRLPKVVEWVLRKRVKSGPLSEEELTRVRPSAVVSAEAPPDETLTSGAATEELEVRIRPPSPSPPSPPPGISQGVPRTNIFLGYAREDRDTAARIAAALESEGWSVWWDMKIPSGRTFDEVIREVIKGAQCVIVLWSARSVGKRWVKTEANAGLRREILVSVKIEAVDPPLAFSRLHAADLVRWSGDTKAQGFADLVASVEAIVPKPRPTRPGPETTPGKSIVVFSDGTGQDGGTRHNTNVYKLFNLISGRSKRQISFYDPGLGTGWRKATGNIVGRGFSKSVIQCYEFIFQNFEDDHEIFLFGFSRGAATVRSLAGFIHLFGILPPSRGKLIQKAWKIYKIKNPTERMARAAQFVEVNHTRWANVQFLGVWDTVAALGLSNTKIDKVINWIVPHGFHDFSLSECVRHACHALAIDDARKTFHPVLFDPHLTKEGQTLRQVWFMGMHTDVGGGYPEKELSDIALEWMVQHAVRHGLHIYKPRKPREQPACTPNPNGMMHNSRGAFWKRMIFKAKQRKWDEKRYGKAVIHESVVLRNAGIDNRENGGYKPWILEHNPDVEPWTHLSDWKADPAFAHPDKQKNLEALEAWCAPTRRTKKIFISYDYDHDKHYKNLLLAWDANKLFDFSFYDESVDISVDSDDAAAIKRVISARINSSTYFLCIVGKHTHTSDWVTWEINKALELKKRLVAIKTDSGNTSPAAILGVGASWAKSFTLESITNAIDDA